MKIKNLGPGLAVDVKIIGFIYKSIKRESNPRDVFYYKEIHIADGHSEIQSEKETNYLFPFCLCFNEPFIIKWQSITEKIIILFGLGVKVGLIPSSNRM